MTRMHRLRLLVLVMVGSCCRAQADGEHHQLFREYFESGLRFHPEAATAIGRTDHNDRWTDWFPAATSEELATLQGFLARLGRIPRTKLNLQDALNLELLEYRLSTDIEGIDRLRNYNVVTNAINAPHLTVTSMLAMAPSRSAKDFEDRIKRLRSLPRFVEGLIAASTDARSKGMVPPRVVIEAVLTQLDAQLIPSADKTPMLAAFRNMPQIVPPEEQERLRRLAERAYVESAQPAWQKYRDYIAGSYLPVGRDSVAISSLPNGKDLYALLVRRSTTTELTPEQIHEIGHREVARIDSQMAKIRKDLGFTGTQEQFNEQVLDAPNLRFKSEAEIISHAREIAKRIDPELPRLFRLLPRMPYGVRPIPSERARTIAPYYERPALDGSRAGYFYVRTVDPEKQSKCCMEALILHEAVPGHHLQNALAQEMEGVPEFRLSGGYGAYSEGWGLYAESLGSELGMYQTPYEQYGRLQLEIFRALRLITDTGLHYYGWTREQGITTMLRARGGLITDDFVTSEVDRYIGSPGQALAYKIGELKIKELRARAEKALSAKFDIREFHDIVLRNGSVPLAILERDVDRWLAAATRRSR